MTEISTYSALNPREFAKKLAETVKGQEEAVEYLSFLARIYDLQRMANHYEFLEATQQEFPRVVMMLTGATGGGKTFIIKQFAKLLGLPYYKIDCSQVTGEGWVGLSVSDAVGQHLAKCKDGYGILHLDEFDKVLPSNSTDDNSNNSNFMASKMNSLLELLDGDFCGTTSSKSGMGMGSPDLSAVNKSLVICTGSFQQARDKEEKEKEETPRSIGFTNAEDEIKEEESSDWKDKMAKLGYMAELSGRISHSIELKPYKLEDIVSILKESKSSPYLKYVNMLGSTATLEDKELEEMAEQALGSKSGLRILNSLLFEKYFQKGNWKW